MISTLSAQLRSSANTYYQLGLPTESHWCHEMFKASLLSQIYALSSAIHFSIFIFCMIWMGWVFSGLRDLQESLVAKMVCILPTCLQDADNQCGCILDGSYLIGGSSPKLSSGFPGSGILQSHEVWSIVSPNPRSSLVARQNGSVHSSWGATCAIKG